MGSLSLPLALALGESQKAGNFFLNLDDQFGLLELASEFVAFMGDRIKFILESVSFAFGATCAGLEGGFAACSTICTL